MHRTLYYYYFYYYLCIHPPCIFLWLQGFFFCAPKTHSYISTRTLKLVLENKKKKSYYAIYHFFGGISIFFCLSLVCFLNVVSVEFYYKSVNECWRSILYMQVKNIEKFLKFRINNKKQNI